MKNHNYNILRKNKLIQALIKDPLYKIYKNGKILTRMSKTGNVTNVWRVYKFVNLQGRIYIYYKYNLLILSRVLYSKFIGNLKINHVIHHKDENPLNNIVKNLEQLSYKKHNFMRFKNKKGVIAHYKISYKIAKAIRKEYRNQNKSMADLSKEFKVSKTTISYVINNKIWSKKCVMGKKHNPNIPYKNKKCMPKWADVKEISDFYKNKPKGMSVDHVIPVIHPDVCGLHVLSNLQYLTLEDNGFKKNKFDYTLENKSWKKNRKIT